MPPVGDVHVEATLAAARLPRMAGAGVELSLHPARTFHQVPAIDRELPCDLRLCGPARHAVAVGSRDIIERDRELTRLFTRAARSRAAKRANDHFLQIATVIVSLEVLTRDFSGWGKRFPTAKQEAEKVLERLPQLRRIWLMDLYFFPPAGTRRELAEPIAFCPSELHPS